MTPPPPRSGSHRAVDDAATEATTAAASVLRDTPVHPDQATWDDAITGRIDVRAHYTDTQQITSPLGVLLLEVARLAASARSCAERAREYRTEADNLEAAAASAAHRLSVYRAAVEALTPAAPEDDQ